MPVLNKNTTVNEEWCISGYILVIFQNSPILETKHNLLALSDQEVPTPRTWLQFHCSFETSTSQLASSHNHLVFRVFISHQPLPKHFPIYLPTHLFYPVKMCFSKICACCTLTHTFGNFNLVISI